MIKLPQQVFIGIDPGKTGSACAIAPGHKLPIILKFTEDYYEFDAWLRGLRKTYRRAEFYCCVEKVHGGAHKGAGRSSPRSMFTFGFHAGFAQGVLCGSREPLVEVTPQGWQKEFGLLKKPKEDIAVKKRRHTKKVRQLYPRLHLIEATADGVLLALYCRRHYKELF